MLNTKLKSTSMKFNLNISDNYHLNFKAEFTSAEEEWKVLDIGNSIGNKHSLTLFCGGSVSGLDWAQSSDVDVNFLAVACNNYNSLFHMNLERTFKCCIQVYEFKKLVNEK